jgi:hypothetical protein
MIRYFFNHTEPTCYRKNIGKANFKGVTASIRYSCFR